MDSKSAKGDMIKVEEEWTTPEEDSTTAQAARKGPSRTLHQKQ